MNESIDRPKACPSCGSTNITFVGPLAQTDVFCENQLTELLPESALYACNVCSLQFRSPVVAEEVLHTLYRRAKQEMWHHSFAARKDWKLADRTILTMTAAGATILDVGCWDGSFLRRYRQEHKVYGVELNAEAVSRATDAGIVVVASEFGDLRAHHAVYDVVTAFDVIEHVVNPRDFLATLASRVRPGGHILLSTGNTNSFLWRWMRHRYWYCSLAEHVSFLCEAWIRFAASELNLEVSKVMFFSHRTKPWGRTLLGAAAGSVHWVSPRLYVGLRRIFDRQHRGTSVPQMTLAKDHMFVVLTRRDPNPSRG